MTGITNLSFASQIPRSVVYLIAFSCFLHDRACCLKYENPGLNELRTWGRGVDTSKFNPAKRSKDFRAHYGVEVGELKFLKKEGKS